MLIYFILDEYTLRKLPDVFLNQTPIMAIGLLSSALLTTFIFYFFRNPVPRAVFILFHLLSFIFIFLVRMTFHRMTLS